MSTFTTAQNTQIMSWITENRDVDSFVDTLIEWVNENTKKTRAKKAKSSEPEDPDRVKKPVPASWMYRTDKRDEIIKDHFDGEAVKGSVIAKKAQELWNELSDEEKRPYEEKRQELWDEYQKYKGASGSPKAEKKKKEKKEKKEAFAFTTDEDCEVPEGWNGPHDGHLHKYVTGLGKKVGEGLFATLAEAIEAANECEECNGITLCKFGYTLREGNNLRKNPTKEPEQTSWVKGVVSEKKVKKVKKSSDKEEKKVKKSSEKKESSEKESSEKESSEKESSEYDALTDDEDDEDDISEAEMKEEAEKAAEAASKILESDNEEDEDEEVDEDEEGGVEVVEWEFDGEDYLVDEESNVVYSVESQEEVGKRVKKGGSWKLVKA